MVKYSDQGFLGIDFDLTTHSQYVKRPGSLNTASRRQSYNPAKIVWSDNFFTWLRVNGLYDPNRDKTTKATIYQSYEEYCEAQKVAYPSFATEIGRDASKTEIKISDCRLIEGGGNRSGGTGTGRSGGTGTGRSGGTGKSGGTGTGTTTAGIGELFNEYWYIVMGAFVFVLVKVGDNDYKKAW